ncbi:MAG: winged helix-turn-helix transcriptional regulator [Nanoarchaeota archaeon]
MKRKNNLDLDRKDKQLLYLLDINGRDTYSKLAKKLQLSKQVVKYRVERLEKEGFIKGYFTMIDTSRLGYTVFRVYLKFRNLTPTKKDNIIDYLKEHKNIWAVVSLAGKWDIALGIAVKDIYEYHTIWEEILKKNLENIHDYKIVIYSPIYHFAKSYLLDKQEESPIRMLGGKEKADFDETDLKILTILSKKARIPLVEISKDVKLYPEALSYRIKQLEKRGIIQGYRAMIDVSKLGYEFYKAEIRLSSYDKLSSIIQFCKSHSNIYQIDKTIGGETLEVEFHVKSLRHMLSILDEFEKVFPKIIERFDYITVLSEEKTTYMPNLSN